MFRERKTCFWAKQQNTRKTENKNQKRKTCFSVLEHALNSRTCFCVLSNERLCSISRDLSCYTKKMAESTGKLKLLTEEQTFVLIDFVESCPILWDVRLQDYRNTERKKATWTTVRVRFQMETGIECTGNENRKICFFFFFLFDWFVCLFFFFV